MEERITGKTEPDHSTNPVFVISVCISANIRFDKLKLPLLFSDFIATNLATSSVFCYNKGRFWKLLSKEMVENRGTCLKMLESTKKEIKRENLTPMMQ